MALSSFNVHQWLSQKCQLRGLVPFPSIFVFPSPFSPLNNSLLFAVASSPSFPLEVGPLKIQLVDTRSAGKLPHQVGAPAEIKFGAYWLLK